MVVLGWIVFVGLGGAIFAIIAMIINLRLLKNMTKFNKRG